MNRSNRFFKPLFDPGVAPWLFLIVAILLGVVGNAAYTLTLELLGTATGALGVGLVAIAVLAVAYWLYRSLGERRPEVQAAPPKRALIALVSYGRQPAPAALTALRYHLEGSGEAKGRLTDCYLLASRRAAREEDEPEHSSYRNAQRLQHEYQGRLPIEIIEVNPEDCADVCRGAREAWRRARHGARLPNDEIVADVTGGTKVMTMGLLLAAIDVGCRVEYLHPRQLFPDGRPDPEAGFDPRLVSLRFFLRWPSEENGD